MVFEIVLPFLQSDSHCSLLIMIRPKIVQENIRPFTICHYLGLIIREHNTHTQVPPSGCGCDPQGSKSYKCDSVGGQCDCYEGFTGRMCEMCKVGYYPVDTETGSTTCAGEQPFLFARFHPMKV